MYGNKTNGILTFSSNSDELFDAVGILSAYMAKNYKNESGSMLDELSISNDEKDIYGVCLKQALPNIYEEMMKMTSFIADSFGVEVKVAEDETDGLKRKAGTYLEFNIRNNHVYNGNVLELVDMTLLNCIKYGVLAEFYSVVLHAELFKISRDRYMDNLAQLRQRMLPLKRKPVCPQV